jgi:hypothetical protein
MDTKKLAKLIKVIVEAEVAKKQEQFLSKTFPKILEEEVNRRVKKVLNEAKGGVSSSPVVEQEIDPFAQAEAVLQQERVQQVQEQRQFTNNPVLNQVLNQTQPFTASQRNGGQVGGGNKSVLDTFQAQQPQVQESYDQTVSFNSQGAQMGVGGMRAQMAAQMGYGDMSGVGVKKTGLGVQTGLPGLDRILNRDNSELVKKFKR